MSEHENTQLVEAIFEAFARGDVPFILDQLTDDVRFVSHLEPIVPWPVSTWKRTTCPSSSRRSEALSRSRRTQ